MQTSPWLAIWAASQALAASVLIGMTATLYHDSSSPQRDERPVRPAPAVWERSEDDGLVLA